jgi:acetoin utilization protein AcuB
MYVGLKMLKRKDVTTITRNTLVVDAEKLMEERRLWMLLIVEDGKLLGYVHKEDVLEALPSRATTLSRHELNYLLSKLKVEKLLRKDVPTIGPEESIEAAAHRMQVEDLAGLAVVDKKNKLLGYINRSTMLDVLVEEMGLHQGGSRIVFEVVDRPGVIHEVSGIIKDLGVSIIATGTFFHHNRRMVVFRVQTENPEPIIDQLKQRGYVMAGPEDFAPEWEG